MSEFDEVLKGPSPPPSKYEVETAKRSGPKRIDKPRDIVDEFTKSVPAKIEDRRQHPGRYEGGSEAVLRPATPAKEVVDFRREEQRAELFLAAQAARLATYRVRTLSAAGPDQSPVTLEAGRSGARHATRHLERALDLGHRGLPTDAVADAVANCLGLIEELDHLDSNALEERNALSSALGKLQSVTNFLAPATRAARQAVIDKHGRAEAKANEVVVTAPLRRAALILDDVVADFGRLLRDHPERDPDAEKPERWRRAATHVFVLIDRVGSSLRDSSVHVDLRDLDIRAALDSYFRQAQRFVDWGSHNTSATDAVTTASVSQVFTSSNALAQQVGHRPLQQAIVAGREKTEQTDDEAEALNVAWRAVFKAQKDALVSLANQPKQGVEPHWSEGLFRAVAQIGLAAIVGGPAGAAGALVSAALPEINDDRGKETPGSAARKGGFGNAVESAVGAALNILVDKAGAEPSSDGTRRLFFESLANTLTDVEKQLTNTLLASVKQEARRSQNPALGIRRLSQHLQLKAAEVGELQKTRAVQDWLAYAARAAHGVEQSGGTDMGGVGHPSVRTATNIFPVPVGVLELEIDLDAGAQITRAHAGTTRADDVAHLQGVRLGEVTMPIQFRLQARDVDGTPSVVVVSRNEAGVYWLRASESAGREALVRGHGGDPKVDADVLRAAVRIIEIIGSRTLTNIEAVRS